MVNLMRKYRQQMLMVVTFFIIITFAWLYNDYGVGQGGDGKLGTIYDRTIHLTDYQRGLRRFQMCQTLGMYELVGSLAGNARTMDEAQQNFIFGSYVLDHEANALAVNPTTAEVVEAVKAIPSFQTNGVFDPNKYNQEIQHMASYGFTAEQIEGAARDDLRVQKLKSLVAATISAAPSEVRAAFEEENQKMEVSFVRLKEEDFAKEIQITDEELKKAFEERKATFQTDQLRKVKYVAFTLSPEEAKLQGKDRAAALQKLVDKASEFTIAMTEKDAKLEEVAKKFGVTVAETPEFSRGAPPAELGNSSAATAAAFDKITLEQPNSDAIPSEKRDGYYVLQLTKITPSRPQTFDEVKVQLSEQLKRERTSEKITAKATEIRAKLEAEMKAGKTFADAAKAAGLTVEKLPAFSNTEPAKGDIPGAREIQAAAGELAAGQLSEVITARGERLIAHMDKRLPIDETAFEKEKGVIAERFNEARADTAFRLWLAERLKAANLQTKLQTS